MARPHTRRHRSCHSEDRHQRRREAEEGEAGVDQGLLDDLTNPVSAAYMFHGGDSRTAEN